MANKITKKKRSYLIGIWAEWVALLFLLLKGYRPIKLRYKCPQGEIDLLVKNKRALIFVEVKYRQAQEDGLHAITSRNQQRVRRAAEHFVTKHGGAHFGDSMSIRFDAVIVTPYFKVIHLKNAF